MHDSMSQDLGTWGYVTPQLVTAMLLAAVPVTHTAGGTFPQHVQSPKGLMQPLVVHVFDANLNLCCDCRHVCNYIMQSLSGSSSR